MPVQKLRMNLLNLKKQKQIKIKNKNDLTVNKSIYKQKQKQIKTMATKEKQAPANGVEKTNNTTNDVVATSNTPVISNEQAAEMLKNATRGEQDSGYLNFTPGESKRVVFKGWKEIPSLTAPGELTKACVFVTDTGKEQINADVAIRSYFEKQPIGVAREIECKGLTKGPKGEYKTFDFFELNVK